MIKDRRSEIRWWCLSAMAEWSHTLNDVVEVLFHWTGLHFGLCCVAVASPVPILASKSKQFTEFSFHRTRPKRSYGERSSAVALISAIRICSQPYHLLTVQVNTSCVLTLLRNAVWVLFFLINRRKCNYSIAQVCFFLTK